MQSITICLPCYNEASRGDFKGRLSFLYAEMEKISDDFEILLVNDGSTDNTASVIKDFAMNNKNVKAIIRNRNIGKGYSIRRGIYHATKDVFFFMDADLSTDLKYISEFLSFQKENTCIIASRHLNNSNIAGKQTLLRKVVSFTSRQTIKLLFNLHVSDSQCGFKCFNTKDLKKIYEYLSIDRWLLDIEILVYLTALNINIIDYPITWTSNLKTTLNSKEALITSIKEMFKLLLTKNRKIRSIRRSL